MQRRPSQRRRPQDGLRRRSVGHSVADPFDNCPQVPNPAQTDVNGNEVGDDCDLLILGLPATIQLNGPINLKSNYVIPVWLLGSGRLDVSEVDVTTLAFGPGAAPLAHRNGPHFDDVNGDGVMDLLGHFRTEEAGIGSGDPEVCLTGETLDGIPFEGCAALRTVGSGCGMGWQLALLLPALMWLHGRSRKRAR